MFEAKFNSDTIQVLNVAGVGDKRVGARRAKRAPLIIEDQMILILKAFENWKQIRMLSAGTAVQDYQRISTPAKLKYV